MSRAVDFSIGSVLDLRRDRRVVGGPEATSRGLGPIRCNLAKQPVLGPSGEVVKNDRITVFTISFFAPDAARTLMEGCASSPALHFRVPNLNIDSACQAIAKTINQLRLTL